MDETISVDTNVIVRFLTKDDPEQFEKARKLIGGANQIFVPDTVILESEWVLRFAYEFSAEKVRDALRRFLGLDNVWPENAERVLLALKWHEAGLDFADALHLAASQETTVFKTFDKDLRKRASDMGACLVEEPD